MPPSVDINPDDPSALPAASCHDDARLRRRANVQKRLSRIEGQVRGLQNMITQDRYCVDILTQIKAVSAALKRAEGELLKDHIDHCVQEALANDDLTERRDKVSEIVDLLGKR